MTSKEKNTILYTLIWNQALAGKVHQMQKSSKELNFLFFIHGLINLSELIMNITFLSIFGRFLEKKSSKYEEHPKKQENDY